MRAPLIASPQQKSSLLSSILGNNHHHHAPAMFRIRRNKWSMLKLALVIAITVCLLYFLKSLWSIDESANNINHVKSPKSTNNLDIISVSQGIAEHLPLLNSTERIVDLNFQASPEPFKKQTTDSSDGSSVLSNAYGRHSSSRSFDLPQLPFPTKNPFHRRRKKPVSLELRKHRLDAELKKLLPIVQGWGEDGKGVHLTSSKDKEKAAEVFKQGAYNVYVSDRVSPNRTLHSVVAKECNDVKYNIDELPNVSVIIIFTNEIFSALVRTVWSVINRTPKKLLKEIILVDDFSDKEYLKQTLRDYVDIYWNTLPRDNDTDDLVKLIHLPSRLGLIKARLTGAREAKGDVLLFLDSHCEATNLWLEPLVKRIKENNKVFICPVIDIINDKTLEYNAVDPYFFQLGGFDWTGHFTWINRKESEAQREPTHATKSPTMAGGLFAVDRKYFFEVGSYDEDMKIWGGENLELSFRVWQCGGRVEIHPCSHVGHIFRDFHPYSFNGIDSHGFNTLRTVYVWMDEYSRYFFMSRPDLLKMDAGNLTKRLKLREELKCQSFKWYLDNIYDKRKFIYDREVIAYGYVQNKYTNLCIDVLNKHETSDETAGLYSCELMTHPLNVTTNQLFSYSKNREIRREEGCLTISNKSANHDEDNDNPDAYNNFDNDEGKSRTFHKVLLSSCEEPEYVSSSQKHNSLKKHKRQKWRYESIPRSNHRLLVSEATDECLTTENGRSHSDLLATVCDRSDPKQHWKFQIYVGE